MEQKYFCLEITTQVLPEAGSDAPVAVGMGGVELGFHKLCKPRWTTSYPALGTKLSLFDGDLMAHYEMKGTEACLAIAFAFTAC